MQKIFNKFRRFNFLSNYIRNIIFIVLILSSYHLIIYAQNAYINDFRVNDDLTNYGQSSSRLGVDTTGNFVVAWNDKRNFATSPWNQIYCQIFDKNGNRIGDNFKIGHDTTGLYGLTVLPNGRFIVFWYKAINFNQFGEIYFQRFDNAGLPLSLPTKVIDTTFSAIAIGDGDIASDGKGNFVIIWQKLPFASTNSILYAQRFDSTGIKIGNAIIVNDTVGFFNITNTNISTYDNGNFVICWRDRRFNMSQQKYDIFFQRFNSQGEKLGNNILVNDDNDTTKEQTLPWINLNSTQYGNFVITWTDERIFNTELMIYYQVFDSIGNFIGSNKRTDQSFGRPYNSKVALDSNSRFIIGWAENWYAGRYQYYSRRYKLNGDTLGTYFMFPQLSPVGSLQIPEDINIRGDRIYTTWYDTRNGNGDIFCNVRSFQNPDTIIIGINPISGNFHGEYKLYPAFPNPFNPETTVKYSIPADDDITLQLFDITGRLIMRWIYKDQRHGMYEIKIYNTVLASGIYFLELKTDNGFRSVQKLILLK